MQKVQNKFGKLGIVTVAALVIFVGFSASKYVEKYTNSGGNLSVAKWAVNVSDTDLSRNNYTAQTITASKIAPGTQGSFKVKVDATGSEVGVRYTVSFTNLQNKPTNLKFKVGATKYDNLNDVATAISGTIDANAGNKVVEKTVEWIWPYETIGADQTATDKNNATDTTEGKDAKTMSFTVNVDYEQVQPAGA